MLGSSCSPCCECTAASLVALWDLLKTKTCGIVLTSSSLPMPQEATVTAMPFAHHTTVANAESILNGIWPAGEGDAMVPYVRAAFFKAGTSPASPTGVSHALALNNDKTWYDPAAPTLFDPTGPSASVGFIKTTDEYRIEVVLELHKEQRSNAKVLPGSPCFVVPSFSVDVFGGFAARDAGLADLVGGRTTRYVTPSQVQTGQPFPASNGVGVAHLNPQYWEVKVVNNITNYSGNEWWTRGWVGGGFLWGFNGWWNYSMKPAGLPWEYGRIVYLQDLLAGAAGGSWGSSATLAGSALGVSDTTQWRAHTQPSGTSLGRWLVGVDPGKLNQISKGAEQSYPYINTSDIVWSPPGGFSNSTLQYSSVTQNTVMSSSVTLS